MDPVIVLAKFEIRSFSRSCDNRGYSKKLGSPWICPRFLFSKIFHGLLFGQTLLLFWPNLKFVALPVPEIIAIGFLGGVQTPNLGEGEDVMVPFAFQRYCRFCAPEHHFFPPHLYSPPVMLTRPEHSRPRPRPWPSNAKAYGEIWSNEILFFRVLLQGYKHSLITSLITDMIHRWVESPVLAR